MDSAPAAVIETHSAVVFFVGDLAVKMKKPVDLGFLDFRTREQREAVCHREVELNRRVSPDVYLGVADVLGEDGRPCEHLVVMRRMPTDRRLSSLAQAGADLDDQVRAVARVVATLHASAVRSPAIDAAASRDAVLGNWNANVEQMERFVGPVLPEEPAVRVARLARRYLAGRGPLFEDRIRDGRACDGHGDLLADDIFCLDDGPRILDCLEFDAGLRYGDALLDAAFLAMDLERLGRPDLATRFLGWWAEYCGENHPPSLAHHYVAYRAQVRAKVSCLRAAQGVASAAEEARRLLDLCVHRLHSARVQLVLVGGLPGTGKSKLARGLAEAADLALISSDETRKDLAGLDHTSPASAPYSEGIYCAEHTARTYDTMLAHAAIALDHGQSVVLDASWTDQRRRDDAASLARRTDTELVELRCDTSPDEANRRLVRRAGSGGGTSDATPAIAAAMAATADPWPAALTVDTTGPPAEALAAALGALDVERP